MWDCLAIHTHGSTNILEFVVDAEAGTEAGAADYISIQGDIGHGIYADLSAPSTTTVNKSLLDIQQEIRQHHRQHHRLATHQSKFFKHPPTYLPTYLPTNPPPNLVRKMSSNFELLSQFTPNPNPQFWKYTKEFRSDIYPFISHTAGLHNAALNKTILITGGGRGIGATTALQFARSGAATIIITGRTLSSLTATAASISAAVPGVRVVTHTLNVSDAESVEKLFAELDTGIDVLVNNAGVSEPTLLLGSADVKAVKQTFEINILGSYLMTRAYIQSQKQRGNGGTIINMGSVLGTLTVAGMSAYSISKLAMNRLVDAVDYEYGRDGFRAYSFHPGTVATDLVDEGESPVVKAAATDTPELGAATAVYLSTERAKWASGRYVSSNWDMEELEGRAEEIVEKNLLRTVVTL